MLIGYVRMSGSAKHQHHQSSRVLHIDQLLKKGEMRKKFEKLIDLAFSLSLSSRVWFKFKWSDDATKKLIKIHCNFFDYLINFCSFVQTLNNFSKLKFGKIIFNFASDSNFVSESSLVLSPFALLLREKRKDLQSHTKLGKNCHSSRWCSLSSFSSRQLLPSFQVSLY